MRFAQLSYLAAIVRNGSFRRAAAELGLAQPSLTQAIQNLEDELQATLLDRGRTGVLLTAVGEAVLPHLLQALECEARIRQEANEHSGLAKGALNIGTVQAASNTLLPHVLTRFCTLYPGISVQVSEAGSADIADEVRGRQLDLGLVTSMPEVAPSLTGLSHEDLLDSRLVLCVRSDNPLARRGSGVCVADFADQPLISFQTGYSMHDVLRTLLAGRPMRIAYQTNNPESAKRMIVAGLGVTVFPEASIVDDAHLRSAQVAYLPISDSRALVKVRVVRRTGEWVSRPAEVFWDMLIEEAKSFRLDRQYLSE